MKTMLYSERYLKYCMVVAMSVIACGVESKIIYVSSSEGIEMNNGLSTSAPVNTIAAALTMGDTILLKADDIFYEVLECKGKYIGRYGQGHNPTLCGFKRIKQPNWEQVEPNIWKFQLNSDNFTGFSAKRPYVNNIGCIHEYDKNVIHGRRVQLRNYLKEDWDFFQTPNHKKDTLDSQFNWVYLYLESDPNSLNIELSVGLSAARIENTVVDKVDFVGFGEGIVCKSNVTIQNCRIDAIGGRLCLGEINFFCQGSGIYLDANGDVTNCKINNCNISRCYEAGISISASYQNKIEVADVSISHNQIANCGRGFEIVMSNVIDINSEDCTFISNTVLDSGNSGFGYPKRYFSTSHVFMNCGMEKIKFIVDDNTFVKGNLYLSSISQNNNLLSDWHNNTCYLLRDNVMIGNLYYVQSDEISVSKVGKLKDAVKLFKENTGNKSTQFILCDDVKIEEELFRRIELRR